MIDGTHILEKVRIFHQMIIQIIEKMIIRIIDITDIVDNIINFTYKHLCCDN